MAGIVFDIARWAGHDGPGIRTIVFLKGCPLRCVWCHSPESQRRTPELLFLKSKCILCGRCVTACARGAREQVDGEMCTNRSHCDNCGKCVEVCFTEALQMAGRLMSVEDVVQEVTKDLVFYRNSGGGVTISGGEPLAQPDLAQGIARGCQELGIHVAVETCGHVPWSVMSSIAPYVDLFLYDLKVMDVGLHRQHTGVSNDLILSNLEKLSRTNRAIQVRVPLIPGYTDTDANLTAICEFAVRLGLVQIAFLPYNPATSAKYGWLERDYKLGSLVTQDHERLERIRELGQSFGLTVQIGG